VVAMIEKAE